MDNSVVTVASTHVGPEPLRTVKRYSKKERRHIMIDQPHVIRLYNLSMGGTDRMDQGIAAYRIGIRGKKWWWPLFTYMLDTAIHNAWVLYRKNHPDVSQLRFRREIANVYLLSYGTPSQGPGRKSSNVTKTGIVSEDIRYDGMSHFVVPNQNRRRCVGLMCKSSVRTICPKCDVGLCIQCFAPYHTL